MKEYQNQIGRIIIAAAIVIAVNIDRKCAGASGWKYWCRD